MAEERTVTRESYDNISVNKESVELYSKKEDKKLLEKRKLSDDEVRKLQDKYFKLMKEKMQWIQDKKNL